MNDVYILDACSLIAYLNDEKGADNVKDLLIKSGNDECSLYIHMINLYEIYYDFF